MSNLPSEKESVQLKLEPLYLDRHSAPNRGFTAFFLREGSWSQGPERSLTLWGQGDALAVSLPPWELQASLEGERKLWRGVGVGGSQAGAQVYRGQGLHQ